MRNRIMGASVRGGISFAALMVGVLGGGAVQAQETATSDESDVASEGDIIVVTATLREQSLLDVPVAISVVGQDEIDSHGLSDASQLSALVPSVSFNTGSIPGNYSFAIRGVSSQASGGSAYQLEQSVALVIDGVVMGLPGMGLGELSDIERIEVLRGPQGMLFGKNASAGLINVVTKDPTLQRWEGNARATYADPLNQVNLRASVNVPLGETVAARVSGYFRQRDGDIYNVVRKEWENDDLAYGGRVKLLWEPSDSFSLLLNADYSESDNSCCVNTLYSGSETTSILDQELAAVGVFPDERNKLSAHESLWQITGNNGGVSLEANYEFSGFNVTSLTSWRMYNIKTRNDIDLSPYPVIFRTPYRSSPARQWTQELRLTSPVSEVVDYVAGLYFYRKTNDNHGQLAGCFPQRPVPADQCIDSQFLGGLRQLTALKNNSYAAYGEATFHLSPEVNLIAGGRYTIDDYSLTVRNDTFEGPLVDGGPTYTLGGPPNSIGQGTGHNENFSWRLGLQYFPGDDLMLYATASRGYKGPTPKNDSPTSVSLTRPEIPTNFEVGFKGRAFDNRLSFSAAVYHARFKDFQATAFDFTQVPPGSGFTNAGELVSKGFELDASLEVTDYLSLTGSLSVQDAKFTDFPGDSCWQGQTVAEGCQIVNGQGVSDSTGNRLPNSPQQAWNISANYWTPVGDGLRFDAAVNFAWRGDVYFLSNNSPYLHRDAYRTLGVTLELGDINERWTVGVFARNLFDEYWPGRLQDAGLGGNRGDVQLYADPEARRSIGVSLSSSF